MKEDSDLLFYKKNGYLIKENLLTKKLIKDLINQINKLIKLKSKDVNYFEYKYVNKKKFIVRLKDPHLKNKLF